MPASKKFNQLCFRLEIKREPDLEYGLIHFLFHGCEMATLRLERLVFTGKRCGCFDAKCAEMGTRFSLQVPVGGSDGRETVPVEFFTETGSIFFRAFGKNASVLRGLGKKAVEIFGSMDGSDVWTGTDGRIRDPDGRSVGMGMYIIDVLSLLPSSGCAVCGNGPFQRCFPRAWQPMRKHGNMRSHKKSHEIRPVFSVDMIGRIRNNGRWLPISSGDGVPPLTALQKADDSC